MYKMKLSQLPCGSAATITELCLPQPDQDRLEHLGFSPGESVIAVRCIGQNGPRIYNLQGQDLAIGLDTANQIIVKPTENTSC